VGVYLHICKPSLQMCVRRVCMYVCIYLHTCAPNPHVGVHIFTYIYTCVSMHVYMSVLVHVCLGIYMYAYMYVKGHCGCIQMQCVHIRIYVYISGFVRVCMCVHLNIYVWRDAVCAYKVCAYKYRHTCLRWCLVYRWVLYVCVGICIYACTRERHHEWIQIHCVHIGIHAHVSVFGRGCVRVRMYTHIWKDTVCVYEFTYVCVYTCIYARRLHMWVRKYLNVCMSL